MSEPAVVIKNLKKYFPSHGQIVKAVDGVNLEVAHGQVFGFLGPNGAGKTTTLRMLCTLMPPTSGMALVAGFDIAKDPNEVRLRIGYVGQNGGSDRPATGRENLILQGRLYGMTASDTETRADELINLLELKEFSERTVYTYSGGQRRRLDVALGLMNRPKVLFLDEPTTGLDPQNRANLWTQIKKLKADGATIFLTTHYLEEADALCDRLAIIDHGKIIVEGTPAVLKKELAGDCVLIGIENQKENKPKLISVLKRQSFIRDMKDEDELLRLYVDDGAKALPQIFQILDREKMTLKTITLAQPSLDDVFLNKTGYTLRDIEANTEGERR